MDPNSSEKVILRQDVKTHPDSEMYTESLTPDKRKAQAGPCDALSDAKRRVTSDALKDVKTDGDSEIYTESSTVGFAGDKGKAISADPTNDDELSDISDDDEDTYETLTVGGVTGSQVSRNAELVDFSYVTNACEDFTGLEDALVRDQHVPGTRSYRKRLKQLKEMQVTFEKNARNLREFCGKLRVHVLWSPKGHVAMAWFEVLS